MLLHIKQLEQSDYEMTCAKMRMHVQDPKSSNELWVLEHNPVYTLGRAGSKDHILQQNHIPIVRSDRGGQVTYHGPGQVIIYPLLRLTDFNLQPLELVSLLESVTIDYLKQLGIDAYSDPKRRGVYVNKQKLASIGLKIHQGRSYHGMALNVCTDLNAFDAINPCGYADLKMVNLNTLCDTKTAVIKQDWPSFIQQALTQRCPA